MDKKTTNKERRDAGLAYIADNSVFEEMQICRRLLQKLNFMDRSDFEGISAVIKELFGKSEDAFVNPPFYCDYGKHIEVGKNFFANYNCTLLDVAKIKIGDNCQMAPNVAIYTAGHPIHPITRNSAYEYGKEVTIGDNVWLGGNTVVCPGVHIGNNVVIGAAALLPKISLTGVSPQEIPAKCFARLQTRINENYFAMRKSMTRHGEISCPI